ncbi:MAG TPA: hypothetical protein VF698_18385 [Thermoanaerobaculia bacterium]|jgi:hypothetical protein
MSADGFSRVWKEAARYRRIGPELRPLIEEVYESVQRTDAAATRDALERLFAFLASAAGRTDANCCVTDAFFSAAEQWELQWTAFPESLAAILDDTGGTLHEAIYAPHIASTFESLPEQLLERVKKLAR